VEIIKTRKPTARELVESIDLPHLRKYTSQDGEYISGHWTLDSSTGKETARLTLEFYCQQLLDLGMDAVEMTLMIGNLYWDCFSECLANRTFEKQNIAV